MFALFALPRCSCGNNDSSPDCATESAPHATFFTAEGFCGGESCELSCDDGFLDCDDDSENGCETSVSALSAMHETLHGGNAENDEGCGSGGGEIVGRFGTCDVTCEFGFFDCDHNTANGCESSSSCEPSFPDAKPPPVDSGADAATPTSIATLVGTPRGLVACSGGYYALDDDKVTEVDATTLAVSTVGTSPGDPAGGLACDGAALYWTTSTDADASTLDGSVIRMDLATHVVDVFATGLDPGTGVEVRDGTVYFFARSGFGGPMVAAAAADGGLTGWMPTDYGGVYKSFALAQSADWSTWNDTIFRRDDAGVTPALHPHATAVFADDAGETFAIVPYPPPTSDGGSDASAPIATYGEIVTDDAGQAALATSDAGFGPVVATSSENGLYAASANTIYALSPPGADAVAQSSGIAFVAADAEWIVWATAPENKSPGALWRIHK